MSSRLPLVVQRDGARVRLLSPAVGQFTCAVEHGRALASGQDAGVLLVLGRAIELVVPEDVAGFVESPAPELVHRPVGFGDVLYELAPLQTTAASKSAAPSASSSSGALVFRSPSSGRYWHRATPGEAPLVSEGKVIERGTAIGLIEVMKTFTIVNYAPTAGLPERARIVRVIASDGAEVADRDPLIELASA